MIHRSLARGLEAVIFAACRSCRFRSASTPTGDSSSKDTLFSRSFEGRRRGLSRLSRRALRSRSPFACRGRASPPSLAPGPRRRRAGCLRSCRSTSRASSSSSGAGVRGAALEARGKAAVAKQPLHVFWGGAARALAFKSVPVNERRVDGRRAPESARASPRVPQGNRLGAPALPRINSQAKRFSFGGSGRAVSRRSTAGAMMGGRKKICPRRRVAQTRVTALLTQSAVMPAVGTTEGRSPLIRAAAASGLLNRSRTRP